MLNKFVDSRCSEKGFLKYLVGLSLAVLLATLFFGLRSKGYDSSNNVQWIEDRSGIGFSKYGIAYTDFIDGLNRAKVSEQSGFSIEMALKPSSHHQGGFNFILVFHDGKDSRQLLVGQWRSSIIVMNGDDYAHRRKTKRIAVDIASVSPAMRFITITSGEEGTKIYLDGQLVCTKRDLTLKMPHGVRTRLVLGNSVYGKNPWEGELYGLALYRTILGGQEIAAHFNRWRQARRFLFFSKDNPLLLYSFDERGGKRALDHGGYGHHLQIPSRLKIFDKQFLALDWGRRKLDSGFIRDSIINLIGFIPLGCALMATFSVAGPFLRKRAVLLTVVLGFGVSLTIEIIQAGILTRSSDGMDLVLNTLGALLGAMICRSFCVWRCSAGLRGTGVKSAL